MVGCAPAKLRVPVAPRVPGPAGAGEGQQWVGPDAARAQAAGASAASVVAFGPGAAGDSLGGRVDLPPDACGLFLARGGPSVEDLDLFVYAEDGTMLGADETPGAQATVMVCPPHPLHLYAFGRVAAGRGLFAVSAQIVHGDQSEAVARSVGVRGKAGEDTAAVGGWPGLDGLLAAHRRQLGGTWRDVRRVAAPMDPSTPTRLSGTIEPRQCLDVLVLPADEIAYVEVTLLDVEGRIIGRAPGESRAPAVVACSAERAVVTLELRPRTGRGLAAVVMSASADARPVEATGTALVRDPVAPPKLEESRSELTVRLSRLGYPSATLVAASSTGVGRRVSSTLSLAPGCSRLDVLAGAPARGVEAWLWGEDGALLAHDDGSASATLFACGTAPRARLDVEALTTPGPYAVELRAVAGSRESLTLHPLAASRLLGRLSQTRWLSSLRELSSVDAVRLASTALVSHETVVPIGRCLDVGLATGAGAEGVDLRLVDTETSEEVALARGAYSAIAEACGLERTTPLHLRIEMRVAAGAADALLGLQPHTPTAAHR
jgi:hypothetical protein